MSAISLSSIVPQTVSTNPVSTNPESTFLQKYFAERRPEVQALGAALKSGDLAAAEQAYNNLEALGNTVLHRDNPFFLKDRALDFNAIGGALQNGDLAGAQQAFAALEATFKRPPSPNLTTPTAPSSSTSPDAIEATSTSGVNVIA